MARLTLGRLLFSIFSTASLVYFFLTLIVPSGERGFDILTDQPGVVATSSTPPFSSKVTLGGQCSPFSGGAMDRVTIIIKLGAPEVAKRLPSYLKTLITCKPNLLLFSDRQDSIDGIEVVDALAKLEPIFREKNPDFEIYHEIHRSKEVLVRSTEGWRLDKYKFLPMMELTAALRPESDWFVFIELDTYVNWDNLYRFLSRFDPIQAHYFGSPVWPKKKTVFAHGGSGIVLSRGALKRLIARGAMFAENHISPGTHLFGKDMQKECCGDEVLAQVLAEAGVKMHGYWPMFNGEKASSVAFGDEHWCEAIISLHHLGEEDFDLMRQLESRRQLAETPLTFKELFDSIRPSLTREVEDWSNLSEDITLKKDSDAGRSFTTCFKACLTDSKCVQCEHSGDVCRLSYSIRLGHKQPPDGDRRWTSGWVTDRIELFRTAQTECWEGAHIVHANP